MTNKSEFADSFDLAALREKLDTEVTDDLNQPIEIINSGTDFPEHIYAEVPKWTKIDGAIAVFADLRNSTQLNVNRHPKTTAHVYEAATGGMVETMNAFEPGFIDIQGDGVFGIFTGTGRIERAMCAAVTLRTFSEHVLSPALVDKWDDKLPTTGIKVGAASGNLLVKRIGIRDDNAPVWSGTPVNFAAKCSQSAEAHEVVITPKVHEKIADNDYLTWSCGCPDGVIKRTWEAHTVETLRDAVDGDCFKLNAAGWCDTHGAEFCDAILRGRKLRDSGAAA